MSRRRQVRIAAGAALAVGAALAMVAAGLALAGSGDPHGLVVGALAVVAVAVGFGGVLALGSRRPDPRPAAPPSPPPPPEQPQLDRLPGSQVEHWAIPTVQSVRSGERPNEPSFAYKIYESIRAKQMAPRFDGVQPIWAYNKKSASAALAARCGVPVPEIHIEGITIDELDWSGLPDRFVLKPLHGAASRGVFLLERQPDGSYVDHLDGSSTTPQEVTRQVEQLVEARQVSRGLLVEELLTPHPSVAAQVAVPDDLKVFCFYDHPAVIMQRRCHGSRSSKAWRFRFWDSEWNDLGAVKYANRLDPELARPVLGDEVVDVVRRLGRELAAPFVRIDVYETARGVVFGEISPHPGPAAGWRSDLDRLLGWEWEIAEARLAIDGRATLRRRDA